MFYFNKKITLKTCAEQHEADFRIRNIREIGTTFKQDLEDFNGFEKK